MAAADIVVRPFPRTLDQHPAPIHPSAAMTCDTCERSLIASIRNRLFTRDYNRP